MKDEYAPKARARAKRPTSLLESVFKGVFFLILLGGVLVTVTAWTNGREAARQSYDRILLGAANDIAESIRIVNGAPVTDLPVSAFDLLAQAPDDRLTYAVRGPDRTLITGYADAPLPQSGTNTLPEYFDGEMQGEPARFIQVSRRFAERDFSGVVTVIVGQTRIARQEMTMGLALDAIVPMGIAGIALVLMAVFVIRSALRPLGEMADDLMRRDPYDLTPIDPTNVPSEIAVIVTAMNRFMDRLDRQMGAMRNLISDTAHQLRTPVAAIRAQAEAVIEEPDPERARRSLGRLSRRTRSLGTLLDQLLSRALVIHRTDSAPRIPVDLRDIALDMVDTRDFEVLAPDIEVELMIGEDPVFVLADDFSLAEATKNLLSNALKHGTAPVRIGARREGDKAILWVEDGGAGPHADIILRAGQRFTRTTSSSEDSAGLGLSIVTAVAEAFEGRLDMTVTRTGYRASLIFPASKGVPS